MPEKSSDQERTEEATPKRREEFHEKGQVAKSRELASVAILGASLIFLFFNASGMLKRLMFMMAGSLGQVAEATVTAQAVPAILASLFLQWLLVVLPLMLVIVVIAVFSNVVQFGFIFSGEALMPKWSKVNPFNGLKNLFGLRSVEELFKSILKIVIVGAAAYWAVTSEMKQVFPLMDTSISQILVVIGRISYKIVGQVCIFLIILAILDYLFQRWEHEKNMKMTRQEVKEEFKQSDGDPLVKGRIRRLQREAARKRMMAAVPKADVVITNPTHYAVAIRYQVGEMMAPIVVAKGADYVARRIREVAAEHHVPIVEKKWVAQLLYRMVNIDEAIPENLYKAVAEILAYVYSLKKT